MEIQLKQMERENPLHLKLIKTVWQAVNEYYLIEPNDKIMVCISGGKDSYTMLNILMYMQKNSPFPFEIIAVHLDQKQPDYPAHILPAYLSNLGVEYKIVEKDTYSIVKNKIPEGKTMCSLCSRLRRGHLYATADQLGITKIALGHHREDIIETFFLNILFSGKIETMPPKYKSDNGKYTIIRPLALCKESDIITFSEQMEFPIIPCNLCGSQENMQRRNVKNMLKEWETKTPGRTEVIFNSLKNISPSHMLDKSLFDFNALAQTKRENDIVTDDQEYI